MKELLILLLAAEIAGLLPLGSAGAEELTVLGRPVHLLGYATQGAAVSLVPKSKYDTERGLQSALMNLFVEGDYKVSSNFKFYSSGMLTVDGAYQLNANRDSWHEKLFAKSRDHLNVDGKYWQVLKEAHVTWTSGDFTLRVGKQVVSWGEMDGIRLMDQINPLDQRRGFADVEFETTLMPIWLIRAGYSPPLNTGWLHDLGVEFVFNPNAGFIPDQPIRSGNDEGGVWAPNILIPGRFPYREAHLGSANTDIDEPHPFSLEGFEYGLRIKAVVLDSTVTLNGFCGLDNDPVTRMVRPPLITRASDGRAIVHPFLEGKYPSFRFIGATFSRDIAPLKASILGGVSPVLRLEAFYAFNNTFATTINTFERSDEFRWAAGLDWKVSVPFLNPSAYFSLSSQFFQRRIVDYPSNHGLAGLEKNNYQATFLARTSYFNAKLVPSVFWMRDITNGGDFFKAEVLYDYTHYWRLTAGGLFFRGGRKGVGFEPFDNKDQGYFKVTYRWS
jgi:hypothetical protein